MSEQSKVMASTNEFDPNALMTGLFNAIAFLTQNKADNEKGEVPMKWHRKQHEWGVIAQCKQPYREFAYCPLCNSYQEDGVLDPNNPSREKRMTPREFRRLKQELSATNPMYQADSNDLF